MPQLISLFETPQIQWIVVLIAVDIAFGIIASLIKKDFKLGKLAGFMQKGILSYVFGFAVLELVVQALPSLAWMITIAFVLIILALIGSILNNLARMGLPLSTFFKKE